MPSSSSFSTAVAAVGKETPERVARSRTDASSGDLNRLVSHQDLSGFLE